MSTKQEVKQGTRIRVTRWAETPGSTWNENVANPPPLEGTVVREVEDDITSQLFWVKFDNGSNLCVLAEDEWEVVNDR